MSIAIDSGEMHMIVQKKEDFKGGFQESTAEPGTDRRTCHDAATFQIIISCYKVFVSFPIPAISFVWF